MRYVRLVLTVALSLAAPAALAKPPTLRLAAEVGPELDSNSLRQPTRGGDAVVASGLMRMMGRASLRFALGSHRVSVGYGGGAKLFMSDDARSADELVHRASLSWAAAAGGSLITLDGSYYDAFQRLSLRDLRTGYAALGTTLFHQSRTRATLRLGYQGLEFKPLPEYSFHALRGQVWLSRRITHTDEDDDMRTFRVSLSYAVSLRDYVGNAYGQREPCATGVDPSCNYPKDEGRVDLDQLVRLTGSYVGAAAAQVWYVLEVNRSNSYGESFVRQVIGVKFTARLLWEVYLTTKVVLQLARFRDPFRISQVSTQTLVDIDNENRSRLVVHLGRDISDHWGVSLRYSVYVAETQRSSDDPTATAGFLRHLLFAGIRFRYNSAAE